MSRPQPTAKRDKKATRAQFEETIWRVPAASEDPHYLVTWSIPPKAMLPLATLRTLLDRHGFQSVETKPIRLLTAIRRTMQDLCREGEEVRPLPVPDKEAEVAYTIARIGASAEQERKLTISQRAAISYLKKPEKGEPQVVYSSAELEAKAAPRIQEYLNSYTTEDLQEQVFAVINWQLSAIAFREKGGVYLIMAGATNTVKRWLALMNDLSTETGQDCHLTTMAVVNTDEARDDIRYHGYATLVGDIQSKTTLLKDILRQDRVKDGQSSVKAATYARYLDEIDELGRRATLIRDTAQLGLAQLNPALAELRAAYVAGRDGLDASKFKATFQRVADALEVAKAARPHVIASAEDAADPFPAAEADEMTATAETLDFNTDLSDL